MPFDREEPTHDIARRDAPTTMLIGLHHVGRVVSDLDRAAGQLQAITGWPVTIEWSGADPLVSGRHVCGSALAEGPNGWIELVAVPGPAAARHEVNEAGVTHAAIQTGNIERVIERASKSGIDSHADPADLGTRFRYLYLRDAEQLITEVEGAPHAPDELEPWLVHGAITTHDVERLRAAYENFVGAAAVGTVRLSGHDEVDRLSGLTDVNLTGTWVPLANAKVEIWQFHHPSTRLEGGRPYESPGSGHLAFETDDLPIDLTRAKAAGFVVEDEPTTTDGVEIARLRDPDGNWVELVCFVAPDDTRSLRERPDLSRASRMDALLHSGSR